ncbi:hypothetical protein BSL78_15207 [Apostichopus japonicus]|uniref:Uncharacterized protein n=1 Tax=Stichopus japonicus TaxID=307972 RepID=A0A2G8KIY7_STIJA|nr:hypothetical protein BSL78_15207 [Apostichopus japonicus]
MKDKMIAGLGHRRLTGPTTALNYLPHNLDMDGDYCQSKGKQLVTYTQELQWPEKEEGESEKKEQNKAIEENKSRPFASEEVGCDRKVLSWMAKTNLDDQCPSSPFPSFPSSSQCSESQQSDGQDTTASTETVPSESTGDDTSSNTKCICNIKKQNIKEDKLMDGFMKWRKAHQLVAFYENH